MSGIRMAGRKLHDVPDEVVLVSLREDLTEFCDGPWWACVALSDGRMVLRGANEDVPTPPIDVVEKMIDVSILLNEKAHMGGHWVLAWADEELTVFWRDRDGDLQFTNTFDEPWVRIMRWPALEFAGRAAAAWDKWSDMRKALEWDPKQMVKRAQGQRTPRDRLS